MLNAIKAKLNRNGNIKLGKAIDTFSKLYSDNVFNTIYGPVLGSCESRFCSGCKGSCYVKKSYNSKNVFRPSVLTGHARNTIAIRNDIEKAFDDIRNQIKRARRPYTIIRVHQSGELESTTEFLSWCKLATEFPRITFYIYTKAFPYVIPALLCGKVPNNFKINLSIWHEYGIKEYNLVKHLPNVKAFIYDDKTFNYAAAGIDIDTYCYAYDEHGKMNHDITCERCKKCFNESAKTIGCYDH